MRLNKLTITISDERMKLDPEIIIESLQLIPHPEGGWFKETYRSQENVDFWDVHPVLNTILDAISLKADERIYYQGE